MTLPRQVRKRFTSFYQSEGLFPPGWKVVQQFFHGLVQLFLVCFWIFAWVKRLRCQTYPNRLLGGRIIDPAAPEPQRLWPNWLPYPLQCPSQAPRAVAPAGGGPLFFPVESDLVRNKEVGLVAVHFAEALGHQLGIYQTLPSRFEILATSCFSFC